jgi:hypothetical protein
MITFLPFSIGKDVFVGVGLADDVVGVTAIDDVVDGVQEGLRIIAPPPPPKQHHQ